MDTEEFEPLAVVVGSSDLDKAVEAYLKGEGFWGEGYFFDDSQGKQLSGEEFLATGRASEFFALKQIPTITLA